jgi:very-short-patch-repair endonuclease
LARLVPVGDLMKPGMAPLNAAMGLALVDLMVKSDPEAQQLMMQVESPIEQLWLAVWWTTCPPNTKLEVQKQIGPYRVDFFVDSRLVVEVDGYEFHMKTRDQLISDYKRERFLIAQGYPVMRFSGFEVWDDPYACGREVRDYLTRVPSIVIDDPEGAPSE